MAVDDPDEIVELLAPGKRDRAERFGLVHLAVADEGPHLAPAGVEQTAVVQISHETGLIDRHDRAQAHRYGRELPEVGHQPGCGYEERPSPLDLLPEVLELRLADAPFEKCARVNAGRGMPLEEDEIAADAVARRAEEVVEADVVERRGRCEARDVAAELRADFVRAHDRGERVPANDSDEAALRARDRRASPAADRPESY